MKQTKRILITGGAGMLGHKLWQLLQTIYPETYVSIRKPKAHYNKCGLFSTSKVIDRLDLRDTHRLAGVLKELRPDVIVNCAGVTLRSPEEGDQYSNISVNALLPHVLAGWCRANNARLIHFSTVCVFTGKTGSYDEDSPPDARDLYGMTKMLGDVQAPGVLTLRSSFIGREIIGGTELLEWFLAQRGKTVNGFTRALFTGLTTNHLAKLVGDLIKKHEILSGLYHISSETLSKYELLNMIKETYQIDVEIMPDDAFECRRNLNGDRFVKATGFQCPSWRQMMAEMVTDQTPYEQWRLQDDADK